MSDKTRFYAVDKSLFEDHYFWVINMSKELIIKNFKPSALPAFWICRTWTKRPGTGWNTQAERFKTEDQAVAFGREHNRILDPDDISRYYEVYKEGTFNHGIRLH